MYFKMLIIKNSQVLLFLMKFLLQLLLQFQLKSRANILTDGQGASLHFVETGPSILREMPWIMVKDHKVCNTYMYNFTYMYMRSWM